MLSPNIVNIDVHQRQYCRTLAVGNKIIGTECSAPPAKWVQDCPWLGRGKGKGGFSESMEISILFLTLP